LQNPLSDQNLQAVSLSSSSLSAEVSPLGAELRVLRDHAGRDLLWDGDPSVWSGRAPLLFPIVGTLVDGSYRLGSNTYRLPRHGFARGKLFDVVDSTPAVAHFRLKADLSTLAVYPFRFELDVRFALDGPTLSITTYVCNAGEDGMPASFGHHPAFRWPLPFGQPRSTHFIEFASDEPAPMRRLNASGLLMPRRYPTPISQRRLVLADSLFQNDVVIFDEIHSRSLTYGAADGPRLRVSYFDTPYLGIWTKPQAEFICIEPWCGVADVEGFSGDFGAKTGVFTLAPGAVLPINMAITLLENLTQPSVADGR
jgi:galactose mutarotase-like enzyme